MVSKGKLTRTKRVSEVIGKRKGGGAKRQRVGR